MLLQKLASSSIQSLAGGPEGGAEGGAEAARRRAVGTGEAREGFGRFLEPRGRMVEARLGGREAAREKALVRPGREADRRRREHGLVGGSRAARAASAVGGRGGVRAAARRAVESEASLGRSCPDFA